MTKPVGHITEIWRFPIKSMAGERLGKAHLTPAGLCGDRALALFDVETGKVASAKNVRDFPNLMACQAAFEMPPQPEAPLPNVEITLSDGQMLDSRAAGSNQRLSDFFGRELRLISDAPDNFLVDQYHPDLPDLNPAGNRDIVVPQPLGASLFRALEQEAPLAPRSLQDLFPLSVMTTATLRALQNASSFPTELDTARFRMNVIVDTQGTSPIENGWTGLTATMGPSVVQFTMPDPRCVMVTRPTVGLPQDLRILGSIAAANRLELPGIGAYPCAGVYAVIAQSGLIRLNDALDLRG